MVQTLNLGKILPPSVAMEAYWMMLCARSGRNRRWPPFSNRISRDRIIRIHQDQRMRKSFLLQSLEENHLHNNRPPIIDGSRSCTLI